MSTAKQRYRRRRSEIVARRKGFAVYYRWLRERYGADT